MKNALLILPLVFLLWGCAGGHPPAPAAIPDRTTVGNGGDDDHLRGNAWFLGQEPIPYCVASGETYAPLVEEAARTWRAYLAKKRVDPRLVFNLRAVPCAEAKLAIHIGATEDETVNKYRETMFPDKSAFSVRYKYDVDRGRGEGIIWIASPDRLESRDATELGRREWVLGHLLHEMGHVLGCGHVADTVMEASIANHLVSRIRHRVHFSDLMEPLGIDAGRELYICRDCAFETKSGWGTSNWGMIYWLFPDARLSLYQIFIDRDVDGGPWMLRFKEDKWKEERALVDVKLVREKRGDVPLFKIAARAEGGGVTSRARFHETLVYVGAIVNGAGERREVRITRNTDWAQLVLEAGHENWLAVKMLR